MNTRVAGIDHVGIDLDDLADTDRFQETDSAYVNRDTVGLRPVPRTGIAGLVDPLHHGAAVNLAAKIDIRGFADKLERYPVVFCHTSKIDEIWQADLAACKIQRLSL